MNLDGQTSTIVNEPLFFTHCTSANVSDGAGLIEMLSQRMDYFWVKPVNIPKITIRLDHGCHPEKLIKDLPQGMPKLCEQ